MTAPRARFTRLRSRGWVRCVLALAMLSALVHCSTRTQTPPLPSGVSKQHAKLDLAGRSVSVTLYKPAKDENAPLVVVAHGFTRSKRYMAGWGGHLADQGFFVVVPTQPGFADHELNGRVLAALVEQYRGKRRVALMGHSMGGLTTLIAASKTPVDAWVGLDPVDMDGSGQKIAATLKIPAAVLRAEPGAWNMQGNAQPLAEAFTGPTFVRKIPDGTHLDAEWPTDLLGQLACGFVHAPQQALFRRHALTFLRSTLMGDAAAAQVLSEAQSDQSLAK